MYKRFFLFVIAFLLLQVNSFSQEHGNLIIENYGPHEYHSHSQNWAIVQDKRGIMYFGNSEGVLEYDGVTWRSIELPGHSTARSLVISDSGIIYVGGVSEIGYLAEDETGLVQYVSLIDKIDKQYQDFFDVWHTCCIGETAYFISEHHIFNYSKGEIKTLKTKFFLENCFSVNNKLYVHTLENGFQKFENGLLVDFRYGSFFKDMNVQFSSSYENDLFIIGTVAVGIYTFDFSNCNEKGPVVPPQEYITEAEPYFYDYYAYAGCHLHDGRYALGLLGHGLVIIDQKGQIDLDIKTDNGLRNDVIFNIYQDIEDNLWLATDNGISKIDINSPISFWGQNSYIGSSLEDIIRFDSTLYIAGFSGVFYFDDNKIKRVSKTETQIYCFLEFSLPENPSKSILLAGTDIDGIIQINDTSIKTLLPDLRPWCMHQSKKDPALLYFDYNYELAVAKYNQGSFECLGNIKGINDEIITIQEDNEGNIWITTFGKGIIRLVPSDDICVPQKVIYYTEVSGLKTLHDIEISIYKDKIIAATPDGLFNYDKEKDMFLPENIFGRQYCDGSHSVSNLTELPSGDFLIFGKTDNSRYYSIARKTKSGFESSPAKCFYCLPNMQIQSIFAEPDDVVWMGGSEGLFRVNTKRKIEKSNFGVLIRKITSLHDTVLYNGGHDSYKNKSAIKIEESLDYSLNTLIFNYAASSFLSEGETQYKYWLKGVDEDWSEWTYSTSKEYLHIPEGEYSFYVKARNIFGIESEETSTAFTISPPWYRSLWVYSICAALVATLIYLIVLIKSRQLIKANVKLEKQVSERTSEVLNKNEEIQAQKDNLQKLNTTKDKFFNIIAHDMKSPFQALIGLSELLSTQASEYTLQEIQNISKMINKSAESGFVLLENLLQWARSQTNSIKYEPENINLIELIDNNIFSQNNIAVNKQIEIIVNRDQDICVFADYNMISTVLRNLISNAIKFTNIEGQIIISAHENSHNVYVSVKDNGVGIHDDILNNLFKLDKLQTTLGTANEKGTGLGLVLCKEFIEANKGSIKISTEEGKGSEFVISIPKCE
ncbi:MAG: HAMP domain-containing sensor histidine kinase [Bacteroidota bacterium]|nr:HAMP domain-containing sensor histidine kinase [Bacteroidota bacterium]